jgi:dTDP-4-amino-4,6-dideoxygalactose transaminase
MVATFLKVKGQSVTREILGYYRDRYLPHCFVIPNGRFGLYAVAKELLRPGDRVGISPITCQTVIGALLAAAVVPVFLPIECDTGNLDVQLLHDLDLPQLSAIVTTNLYGNPDNIEELSSFARARGILLVEDCAHILRTRVAGREIGTFGDVSVFSFKKYFGEWGGVVALRNEDAARRVQARIAAETLPLPLSQDAASCLRYIVSKASPRLTTAASQVRKTLHKSHADSVYGSCNLTPPDLITRRNLPSTAALLRVVEQLKRVEQFVDERHTGAEYLKANYARGVRTSPYTSDVCYLAVPLICPNRQGAANEIRHEGIPLYYLYKSLFTDVLGERCESVSATHNALISDWCDTTLPVNPQFAQPALAVIHRCT